MTYKGIIKGNTIELEKFLPYRDGQPASVSVAPIGEDSLPSAPLRVLHVLQGPPHISDEDIYTFEQAIEKGKLPVRSKGPFDR